MSSSLQLSSPRPSRRNCPWFLQHKSILTCHTLLIYKQCKLLLTIKSATLLQEWRWDAYLPSEAIEPIRLPSQSQSTATGPWPALNCHITAGRKLSWPGWLVTHQDRIHVTYFSNVLAWQRVTLVMWQMSLLSGQTASTTSARPTTVGFWWTGLPLWSYKNWAVAYSHFIFLLMFRLFFIAKLAKITAANLCRLDALLPPNQQFWATKRNHSDNCCKTVLCNTLHTHTHDAWHKFQCKPNIRSICLLKNTTCTCSQETR